MGAGRSIKIRNLRYFGEGNGLIAPGNIDDTKAAFDGFVASGGFFL
jgi:hypothetical protein